MLNQAEQSQTSLPVTLQGWELILLFFYMQNSTQLQLPSFRPCCRITLYRLSLGNSNHFSCGVTTRSSSLDGAGRADPVYAVQSAEAAAADISLLSNPIPEGLCGTKSLFPFLLRSTTISAVQGREEAHKMCLKKDSDTEFLKFHQLHRTKHLSITLMVSCAWG